MTMDANSKINWSYIGGLFDGEGCISLGRYHAGRHTKDGNQRRYVRLTARIYNSDRDILLWVRDFVGCGSVTTHGNMSELSKKPVFAWISHTASARRFLREVLPYCRIKNGKIVELLQKESSLVKPKLWKG